MSNTGLGGGGHFVYMSNTGLGGGAFCIHE